MAKSKTKSAPPHNGETQVPKPSGAAEAGAADATDDITLRLPSDEMMDIDALVPYATNARTHSADQIDMIAGSIKKFGFTMPVLVWKDNTIIAGHCRVMACKKLGIKKIPVRRADYMTDAERKAYVLADNRMALESGWDHEMLRVEMAHLNELGVDLSSTGFSADEIQDLLATTEEGLTEDDIVPEVQAQHITQPGDVWLLGRHRLMCGDSFSETDLQQLLAGASPELTFTDPPYEIETEGGGILAQREHTKEIKKKGLDKFDPSMLILHSATNIYFHNKPLIKKYIELGEANKKPWDLHFYKKENPVPNHGGHVMTDVEYIAVIGKQAPNRGLEKDDYSKSFTGKKDADNSVAYSKPVALCCKYLRLFSRKSVLDSFGGSGSTLIAAEKLGRAAYCMEHLPEMVDVIVRRWEQFTGQQATLEGDGRTFKECESSIIDSQPPAQEEPEEQGE